MAVSTSSDSVESVFKEYVDHLQKDHEIRDVVRETLRNLEQSSRELSAIIQKIHTPGSIKNLPTIVKDLNALFEAKVRPQVATLASAIPEHQYHRFHQMFNWTLQRLVFAAAMTFYLEEEKLLQRSDACRVLGVKLDPAEGFHLELEDYLGGLIQMSNELARFSVNCVTQGDYQRPVRLSSFVSELLTGFRLLNLKNDSLRKKFDSLKYDMKKLEEVVYDISLRGLIKNDDDEDATTINTDEGDASAAKEGTKGE